MRRYLAIDGVSCVGKSTTLRNWNNVSLCSGTWTTTVRLLNYSTLKTEYPVFKNKDGDAYLELAYCMVHMMRSLVPSTSDEENELVLLDRCCLANLVHDLIFFLHGEEDFDGLYTTFQRYDEHDTTLNYHTRKHIESVEAAVSIIGREFLKHNYAVLFVVPANPFELVDRLIATRTFDARLHNMHITRSQMFVYTRLAKLLPPETYTIVEVDPYIELDKSHLEDYIQHNCLPCQKK